MLGTQNIPIGQIINQYLKKLYPHSLRLVSLKKVDVFRKCQLKREYIDFTIDCLDCMFHKFFVCLFHKHLIYQINCKYCLPTIVERIPSFISTAQLCYMPLVFCDINFDYTNYNRTHTIIICYQYDHRPDISCESLGNCNRKVFQLKPDKYQTIVMEHLDVPVVMMHACCLNKEQATKYFQIDGNDYQTGKCNKRGFRLHHNFDKNKYFFLDPVIGRTHRPIYLFA